MADKCAPHPWAKAQSRPSNGKKIKSILLLFSLCTLFAPRVTPDSITKRTRTLSVIFPPQEAQTELNKYKTKHHNPVFLNTTAWDSHPHASPEGLGTTPSAGSQRRSAARSLGAAMRLTALRHPKESPKLLTRNPKNSRPKITPKLPDRSNKTAPQGNVPVLPNPGKPRRGDYRGEQYGPDASCASTLIIPHNETTNKMTPSINRDGPHTANRILEPKNRNGTLQHPTQAGRSGRRGR